MKQQTFPIFISISTATARTLTWPTNCGAVLNNDARQIFKRLWVQRACNCNPSCTSSCKHVGHPRHRMQMRMRIRMQSARASDAAYPPPSQDLRALYFVPPCLIPEAFRLGVGQSLREIYFKNNYRIQIAT